MKLRLLAAFVTFSLFAMLSPARAQKADLPGLEGIWYSCANHEESFDLTPETHHVLFDQQGKFHSEKYRVEGNQITFAGRTFIMTDGELDEGSTHWVNGISLLATRCPGASPQTQSRLSANAATAPEQPAQSAASEQPTQATQSAQTAQVQNTPLTNQDVVAAARAQSSPEAIIQKITMPTTPTWEWTSGDKWDHAHLKSESGNEEIDLAFYKHELANFHVLVPANSITIKVVGNVQKEREKNKLPVQLAYDDGASVSKTWGVIQFSDALVVAPRDDTEKEFKQVMKSKKFTVSYTDVTGAVVTGVFNIGDISEQMKTHGVHFHKFGLVDGLRLAAAAAPKG